MILQLNPAILVDTPLGRGLTIFIIDYGMHQNSCWVVALESNGVIKHFDCNDVVLTTNYTYRMNLMKHHPELKSKKPVNNNKQTGNGVHK